MNDLVSKFLSTPATQSWAKSLKDKSGARVGAMLALDPRTPDETAEAMRVGEGLGLPANVVAADVSGFKRQLDQKKNTTALSGAPKTAKWLEDLNNGILAKDDVDNLTWFEKSMLSYADMGEAITDSQFGRGVQTGATGAKQIGTALKSVPTQGNAAQNRRLLDLYEQVGDMDAALSVDELAAALDINPMSVEASFAHGFLTSNPDRREQYVETAVKTLAADDEIINETREAIEQFSADMQKTQGRTPNFSDIDDVGAFADWFAFNSGQSLPYLAITGLAGLLTGGAGVVGSGYLMGVGDINAEMLEQGITDQANNALVGAIPYAGLELLGPAARPFRNVGGNVLESVAEGYFKRAAKEVPANAVEEFINEAGQEIIKDLVVADAGGEEVTLDNETLLRWFDSGMAGAAGGASVSAVSTALTPRQNQINRDMQSAANAGTTAAAIDEIDRMAANSKLRERAPDKFAEALDAQGESDFYIAADDLREYFQAKDMEFDDETLEAWGIDPIDFRQAESTGGDVTVSRSAYATRISGTEDAAWFRDNAIRTPGEMSVSQAARFNSEVRDVMDQALADAEDQRTRDLELRDSDVKVYDNVFSQLRAAGRTRDVADNEARVWSSFWRTMADRYGGDPLELAQSMGVQIVGPQTPDAARRRNDLDIKLNTLRSNPQRALRAEGTGLLDFVRSKGGISDIGGDVAAMDAPKGIISETREQAEARRGQPNMLGLSDSKGTGLDEIGRAAIEAGYFPELMGGSDVQADGTVVDEAAVLLEALQRAISGEAIYPVGEGPNQDMVDLSNELSRRGIDLAMSNDEIAAALEDQGGLQYDQSGKLITDTPEFRAWFGDSKVVDENGDPVVVYHGSNAEIEEFDGSKAQDIQGRKNALGQGRGKFYFSEDESVARSYSLMRGADDPVVNPVYLRVENPVTSEQYEARYKEISGRDLYQPYDADFDQMDRDSFIAQLDDNLKSEGVDGIINDVGQIAVFSPTQIKSVYNRGTFDANDPRILYQDQFDNLEAILAEFEGVEFAPERSETLDDVTRRLQKDRLAAAAVARDELVAAIGNRDSEAAWTEERLRSIIQEGEHSAKGESKFRIGFVDPLAFVEATADSPARIADEAGDLDVERLKTDTQTPFITVKDGEIVGHEGRHRMIAMAKDGVKSAPILIRLRDGYENAGNKPSESFLSQTFTDGPSLSGSLDVSDTFSATTANEQAIIDRMLVNEPRILFQSAAPSGSDAFRAWAGTNEVLDSDEVNDTDFSGSGPWVVRSFHGTTHEFSEFDASIKGTKEGQFGAVNYFTTSEADASGNYGASGPDLTNRIENAQERAESNLEFALEGLTDEDAIIEAAEDWISENYPDFDISSLDQPLSDDLDEAADGNVLPVAQYYAQIVAGQLQGGDEKVLEVFIRTEKPFVVGGEGSPFIEFADFSELEAQAIARVADDEGVTVEEIEDARDDYEDQIDEARWDLEAETENPLFVAVQEVADRYDMDASALLSDLSEISMEGTDHNTLEKIMRDSEGLMYAEDPETGDTIGYHVLAEIVEALGFDSIILKNADQRFSNMDIELGTAHIHVFDSHNTNIKSVDNQGTFDRSNPNIFFQTAYHGSSNKFEKFELSKAGSGMGNDKFGFGIYFGSDRDIATQYRTDSGRTFTADIPEDKDLIKWDDGLDAQPFAISEIIDVLDTDGEVDLLVEDFENHDDAPYGGPDADEAVREYIEIGSNDMREALTYWGDDGLMDRLDALRSKFEFAFDDSTGGDVYDLLSGTVGSKRAASELFQQIGVKGVKANDKTLTDGGFNFVVFNPDDIKVLEFEQQSRGSIQLPSGGLKDGQTVINLFESANLSTFIHESGHFFLEAFTALATSDTAPQGMKDDLAAIHKFLKVDGTAPLTTAQHEMWARAFEAYAMEGKAPSLALADAFGRFKSWLTRIYKTALGLNVKITPEIREVMDRMLATDTEIAAAREMQQMSPLFTSEAAAGMTPAAWETYQKMARRSEEQASQALLEKTMAKVRREKEKWWKDERADVRKEVTTTIDSKPEYRLIEMLANQKWIGSDDPVPDFQLDRAELVETFGDGVLSELSRSRFGGKRAIYGADGISLYEAAEFFGFANPTEMVETLQNTVKKKDAIELETDRIMADRYGDPLNDGSIEEEAVAAIHSDQQAQTVAAEARHLAGQAGKPTRNMTAKVFRQRARMMLSRMSVKDATRPNSFLEAERRSAKRAEEAFARTTKGRNAGEALAAAAKHKEQQMLNHYLYMESRDLTKMVASKREKMRNYSKASVREKIGGEITNPDGTTSPGYIQQIDALLDGYDFRVRSAGQVKRSEKLRAFVERMVEEGREGELAIDERLLDEANRKHYTKMSVDELQGLFDTIENIDHMGRHKQKLVDAKNKRDLQEVADTFSTAISNRFGTGKAANQSKQVRNFFNLLFSVDTMMVDLDGTETGDVYDLFKAPLDRGQALEQQMNVAMAEAVEDISSVYSSKELSQMQVQKLIPGGNGHTWSKMEIISLALNTGHQDGRNRILEDTVHPERRLTQDQLDALLDTLEKGDWDFVQSMLKQVNSYWPELAATHKRRKGTELKKVEAVPIETKFGVYPGGYYPLAYDSQRSIGAAKDEASAWDKFNAAGRGSRIEVKSGMTIARKENSGGRTLDFDLNVALRHMRDTIRVITMSEVVDNAARIIKHKDVETAFMDAGQTNQFNTLKLFLDDLAVGPVYNTDPINSFARVVKNNFTMAKLAFNFKTVALQVTGITQSAVVVGKRNMVRGYRDYLANPNAAVQMAMEKSAFMSERKTSFQKDIYDQINDIQLSSPLAKRTTKVKNAVGKAGFYPMIRVQFLTVDVPTWIAAHDAKLREGATDEAAVKYADRIVARSQGSGLYADRNALERGTVAQNMRQSDFIRLWTTLGSYMVTKMNRGYLAAQKGKRGISEAENVGEMAGSALNMASDLALLYMAEAIMMGLAYALLAGDDADEEDLTKFIMTNTATSVIGGVPIVSGVANAFQGYGAGGVLASVLEMPANVATQLRQGENDAALWRSISDAGGMLTGLPSTATYRAIEGIVRGADEGELPLADMFFGSNPLTR